MNWLKTPGFYLLAMAVLLAAVTGDSFRAPEHQATARLYARAVGWYQYAVSPHIGALVRCRFRPTCSTYSLHAVERFGIRKGLWLSAERIARCRGNVRLGTPDPVPN